MKCWTPSCICPLGSVIESSLCFSVLPMKRPFLLTLTIKTVLNAGYNAENSTAGRFGFGMTAL